MHGIRPSRRGLNLATHRADGAAQDAQAVFLDARRPHRVHRRFERKRRLVEWRAEELDCVLRKPVAHHVEEGHGQRADGLVLVRVYALDEPKRRRRRNGGRERDGRRLHRVFHLGRCDRFVVERVDGRDRLVDERLGFLPIEPT